MEIRNNFIEEILSVAWPRLRTKLINPKDPYCIDVLVEVANELYGVEVAYELHKNLLNGAYVTENNPLNYKKLKEDFWVKNKQSGNVYTVKSQNPEIHTEPSKDEIEAAKKEKSANADNTQTSEPTSYIGAAAGFGNRVLTKIKNWTRQEKEYFQKGYHKPGSEQRRNFSTAFKDKLKGAWNTVKDGLKHEYHTFKTAAGGVSKFFKGEKLTDEETSSLKKVGIKIATTALFAAVGGGLAHGATAFAKHVAIEFVPHVVGETLLMGGTRAALFADEGGDAETDLNFQKFGEMIADGLENMEISPEQMEAMVDSYEEKKKSGEIKIEPDTDQNQPTEETPKEKPKEEDSLEKDLDAIKFGMMTGAEKEAYLKKKRRSESIYEAGDIDVQSVLDSRILNPDTNRQIKVSTGLGYDKASGGYQAAKAKMVDSGISDDEIEKVEKEETPKVQNKQDNGYIGSKDKTLSNIDTLKSEEFNKPLTPNDDEFNKKNQKFANPIPPEPYKLSDDIVSNPKFPKKYLTALERMMNTLPTGDATKWYHYSDSPGGAGQISAQAGELMTMIGASMTDDEFKKLTNSLLEHESALVKNNPKLKNENSRIITKSWITAAQNNRTAILNNLKNEFPNSEIIATAWDTKNDVESLGMKDYKKNKGFSTDMYIKVKTKDGKEILKEVSLKKSTLVNFLNSGAGMFSEWDSDLPDDINQNIYRDTQRNSLVETGNKLKKSVNDLLKSNSPQAIELKKVIESKGIDFDKALEDTQNGNGSRGKSKVILEAIKQLANAGNKDAEAHIRAADTNHRKFQEKAIRAITENPKMKEGMLKEIRSEFPLKAVSDGEETMAIGENSLDRSVMKKIFGTDKYDEIKEKLEAHTGPPPYLGYRADVGGEVIPLAQINIREDGVGYGGQIKFEMLLDKRFAKILKQANIDIYSKK